MAKFPEPPPAEALARVPPHWRQLRAGTLLFRVYFRGGEHPASWKALRRFGPTAARFDHHNPPPRAQERGILYAALHIATCLAEVFQSQRTIDAYSAEPWLVGFRLTRAVRLLDLRGRWPTRAGASMAISSGPRPRAQRWSRAIYLAYPDAEGLWYASSMHGNAPAVALYERVETALPDTPAFHRPLSDPTLLIPLENAALDFGYALVVRTAP